MGMLSVSRLKRHLYSRRHPGVCCRVTEECSWMIGGRVFSALYRWAVMVNFGVVCVVFRSGDRCR